MVLPLSHVIPAYHVLAWPRKDGMLSQILSSGRNENLNLLSRTKKNIITALPECCIDKNILMLKQYVHLVGH